MHDRFLDHPVPNDPAPPASGPSLWEIVWQRKAYVALGAVVGLALGVLYWSMTPKVYESSAQVWVLKKQPNAPLSSTEGQSFAGDSNPAEDFLSTHQTVLRSAVILSKAVAKGHLRDLETFRASKRPARDLNRALTVSRDRDKSAAASSTSQVLNISFRCNHAEDCAPVLSAVIDSYGDFLNDDSHNSAKKTLKLINDARELLENKLEAKQKAYDEFRHKMPVLWKSQYGTTLYQDRLAGIDAQRAVLVVRMARIRATLEAVDAAVKEGRDRAELLDIVSALPGQAPMMGGARMQKGLQGMDSGGKGESALSSSLEQELIQLQLEEGKLLEDFGPSHPRVQSLRDRKHTIRGLLAPSTTPKGQTAEQRDREARAKENLVELRIGQLKQELAEAKRGLESLDALFQTEMREAKKVFPYETQEESFRREIASSQLLYNNIIKQLDNLNLVSNSGGFETQVITPPTEAEKVAPRGSVVLPMALFLGLLLGCGLAYLAELTDKSFRSPEDVRRRLGLPIMGFIPRLKPNAKALVPAGAGEAQLDSNICTWHRAASKEAEAYRGVRTALYFSSMRRQGRKIIQVTSPNQGDGKSTLAANLAVSIAQSGKRVLLVDADLRRPTIGKLFGITNPAGFASVLGGLTEMGEAICPTGVPGLVVMPSGPLPPNPSELLTAPRLREVLEWMREHYDYIVLDTPPLLAVTDPGVVGPQVDGVIVTLRATKRGRVEAERAKEILDNLGINIFGIVLNDMDHARSGEGYGYYGYEKYEIDAADAVTNGTDRNARPVRAEDAGTTHESNGAPLASS